MEYLQTAPAQLRLFFYAFGFGLLLGVLYDALRFLRLLWRGRRATVVLDILFVLAAAWGDFCFRLVMDHGRLRLYVFCGQVLGWLLYLLTFGRLTVRAQMRCAGALHAGAALLARPFRIVSLHRARRRRNEKREKNIGKNTKKRKKRLEKPGEDSV